MNPMKRVGTILVSLSAQIFLITAVLFGGAGGCGGGSSSSTPDPTPQTGTNATSGGVATVSTGTQTIGFIPNGLTLIAVPLETSDAGGLQVKPKTKATTTSVTISFNVDSCAADGTNFKVICVGYTSSMVAILDISDFIAKLQNGEVPDAGDIADVEVDLGNTTTAGFSGGSCLNCGVLTDPEDDLFIVSSGDGYRVLTYADNTTTGTATIDKSYLSDSTASPARSLATENFSYDATNNRIISPEYSGLPDTNQYLWVIDITKDIIYRWIKKMVDVTDDADGLTGFGDVFSSFEADAVTIDASTGVMAIADESQNGLLVVNMNDAVFDDTAKTYTASYSVIPMTDVVSRLPGMAVESTNHFLFLEEELGGTGMGVAQLPTSSAAGSVSVTDYNSAAIPSPSATCSGDSSWANAGDPHGLALFTSVIDDKPIGLLINDSKDCAALVDLEGFLAATKTSGSNTVDPSVDLVATGVVTFVSLL